MLSYLEWMIALVMFSFLFIISAQEGAKQEAEKKKLRALADNLILTTRGLTSRQNKVELEMAEEFAPLAEYFIREKE